MSREENLYKYDIMIYACLRVLTDISSIATTVSGFKTACDDALCDCRRWNVRIDCLLCQTSLGQGYFQILTEIWSDAQLIAKILKYVAKYSQPSSH